ncbi:uncharacterized protein IWZ02DRAFT_466249 [Phyllosticta citriasiana]|uniref:Ubiquitin-like protease family profile domain-containing protein n=1 Tax=Phyllosticta citriasiana TaxID=595635 RepID=A0ABR1K7B4_9PEZI
MSSPSTPSLTAQLNDFEQAATESSATLLEDYFALKDAFSRRKQDVWSRLHDPARCTVALGHLASSHCATKVRRMVESPWNLDAHQLLREFGPRALMSRDLISELAKFATHAPPIINSQRALATIREAQANRLAGKESGVQRNDYIQPIDVRTAMKKCIGNITSRKRKRPGTPAAPPAAQGPLDAAADYLSDSASEASIEHARNKSLDVEEEGRGAMSPETAISDEGAAEFADGHSQTSDSHPSSDESPQASPTSPDPDLERSSKNRPPISPTPASPKALHRRLGKMRKIEDSLDKEQEQQQDVLFGSHARPDDLMPAAKPMDHVPTGTGLDSQSGPPLNRRLFAPSKLPAHANMPRIRRPLSPPAASSSRLIEPAQAGQPEQQPEAATQRQVSPQIRRPLSPPAASSSRLSEPAQVGQLEQQSEIATQRQLSPQVRHPRSPPAASLSRLFEPAQVGQLEQRPEAATRRRLSMSGWLSATDISQLISKFMQPDCRLLDIGRSGDSGPWSEWTARYTLEAEHRHVLVPVHMELRHHWVLLYLDITASRARLYDSLATQTNQDATDMARAIASSMNLSWGGWQVETVTCIRQTGTDDCGIFTVIFAIHILARAPLPDAVNAPLWRLLFQHLLLGEIETGIGRLIQHDQPAHGSQPLQILSGLLEVVEKAKKLWRLDRDLSVMSRPLLDFVVKTDQRVKLDGVAIETQSAHIQNHRLSLAYYFPTQAQADGQRDSMASVLGWMEANVGRLKASRDRAQACAKEIQAGYQSLKESIERAMEENEEQLRQARVEMDEASRILGQLSK